MKRILSALIAVLMLAACLPACAESGADICGEWYVSYVITADGILTVPGDVGFSQTFFINEDGSCSFGMYSYNGQGATVDGTWAVNADGMYEMTFADSYTFVAGFDSGMLVALATDGSIYWCSQNAEDAQQVLSFIDYSDNALDEDFFGDWVCAAVLYTGENGSYEYYSRNLLGLDFAVSIGLDESGLGGYTSSWHIGGVGEEVYNEDVTSQAIYEMDESGDVFMYSMFTLSNGMSPTVYMYLDETGNTLHVYGIYGVLVFTRADELPERPAVIDEAFKRYTEQ